MAQRCFLAVDLGAESGRVVAGLLQEGRVELQEIHRFGNGGVSIGGSLRWDVVHLWSEIQNGIAKAAARFGEGIVSIGVDTWGVDHVLMTADDELLGLPYHYRDGRIEGMLNYAFSRVSREEIFAQTGLQFMEINSLYQLLAMDRQHPQLMELADRFLMMPDFFHWLLCGSRVGEFTNATTTQCYHAAEGAWAADMLRKLGLRPEIFPDVVAPGTKLGPLREDVAKKAMAPRFDVVAPATHDTGAAVVAVPTELTGAPKWAYISSGTWSLMGVEVADAVLTPRALELNVTNEGGVDGTYRLLKNIMGLWLVQECRRCFERDGRSYDYAALTQLAIEAPALKSIINPDDQRFFHPENMPHEICSFCQETGQPVPETDGQIIRCALESLALKYRMVLGWMEELTGTQVEAVHVVGGGSKNDLLNQFTANACGRPVVAGPVEATALGNVLLQARTAGDVGSLDEIRAVVRNSSDLTRYTPEDGDAWSKAYERFVTLGS